MNYATRVASVPNRPSCWGNKETFDPDDNECQECGSQHSCRQEVGNRRFTQGPTYTPSTPVNGIRPTNISAEQSNWEPGLTYENENPFIRLAKDALIGGLRGGLFEGYRFFSKYRIR